MSTPLLQSNPSGPRGGVPWEDSGFQVTSPGRRWLLAAVFLLMGVGAFSGYRNFQKGYAVLRAAFHRQSPMHEVPKGADPETRKRVQARLATLRAHSRELQPCPLLFPLLDKQGVSPLGSYLSYLGMKRASYLPESVMRIPNIGDVFQKFELFTPGPRPVHAVYRRELPNVFRAVDFGEGTCLEKPAGFEVALRFWGTRAEKRYSTTFPKDQLNRAPAWIGGCIHDWMGFKPNAAQTAFLASPIFTSTEDLARGARMEPMFRTNPGLVNGWDLILAKNPGNAVLFDRWLSMTHWREYGSLLDATTPRFAKAPQDALLRFDHVAELSKADHHEEAFNLLAEDLARDDDNPDLYQWATHALQKLQCDAEAIQLLEMWGEKHPGNPDAWMALAEAQKAYAWVARGNDNGDTVTDEGWRLMRERMAEAVKAATRATEVGPRDCRSWATLLGMGTSAQFPRERMETCFSKVLELNPYYYPAYETYANYLKPKWFGDEETVHAFADKHADRFPLLTCGVVAEDFWVYTNPRNDAGKRARNARLAENVRESPFLETYERRMKEHLRSNPLDYRSWTTYLFWMVKIGKRDETLAFAQSVLGRDPDRKSWHPALVLEALRYETNNLVGSAEEEAYDSRADVVRLRSRALQDLVEADPSNWAAWNQLAKLQVRQGNLKEARASFERIGTRRVAYFWDQASFEKAKAKALGPLT